MAVNTFSTSVQSLFDGMNGILSTKSVVGEPITVNDTIIIPLVDVSFGMGTGSTASDSKKEDWDAIWIHVPFLLSAAMWCVSYL